MKLTWAGIAFILVSFYFTFIGLLQLFPIWISAPCLFISILFTIHQFTNRHRFRGF
ncbi:hypothetical protein CR203_10300 [Salipaludibacillus neizhouensis]|uniref:Uncharacterized protein n=1 Tax=Salipaludibacillus neizhouensis TaxID=885475 RepID=A0A3A9K897_9BACI|nr:hypothetical protein [Salipaludibacillus neizhouensis]RKL67728.1 hypothetical protein CR203_10300 [Salipaludibacillus neizhouensis]